MAAAQVATRDSWWRLANELPGSRCTEPTVVGVDFPTLSLDRAWWDAARAELTIGTTAANDAAVGKPTTFGVENVDDPSRWTVSCVDGTSPVALRVSERGLEIDATIGRHTLVVTRP